jgi:hypothetical protein
MLWSMRPCGLLLGPQAARMKLSMHAAAAGTHCALLLRPLLCCFNRLFNKQPKWIGCC